MVMQEDLIFRVLKFAEKHASPQSWASTEDHICFEKDNKDEVNEHIRLCEEAGWLEMRDQSGMGKVEYAIVRLTLDGHRELKRRRNEGQSCS